jgi:hypothetical protein
MFYLKYATLNKNFFYPPPPPSSNSRATTEADTTFYNYDRP